MVLVWCSREMYNFNINMVFVIDNGGSANIEISNAVSVICTTISSTQARSKACVALIPTRLDPSRYQSLPLGGMTIRGGD